MNVGKRILSVASFFAVLSSLTGCSHPVTRLTRPDITDLAFWITQQTNSEEMEERGCTYLPGWSGASEYLDPRYKAVEKDGMATAPDVHVTYLLTGYPDVLDDTSVTRIEITDPEIRVYGLHIGAVTDQIRHQMDGVAESLSFQLIDGESAAIALIQNCTFIFSDSAITISAPVSNQQNVQF